MRYLLLHGTYRSLEGSPITVATHLGIYSEMYTELVIRLAFDLKWVDKRFDLHWITKALLKGTLNVSTYVKKEAMVPLKLWYLI